MNRKKIKVLRRKAKHILVEWLRSLLPEEEQEKVNINTILHLMPKQTHYMHNFQIYQSAWSFKWVMKRLKLNPHWTLKEMSKSALPSARALSREDKDD